MSKHYPDGRYAVCVLINGERTFPVGWVADTVENAQKLLLRAEAEWPGREINLHDRGTLDTD